MGAPGATGTHPAYTQPMDLQPLLARTGFAFVRGADMRAALASAGPLDDWPAFAASWNDLSTDTCMADGGRYRRRRHAVYAVPRSGPIARQPHQPHFQTTDYNPLNGGVQRWFEPVLTAIGDGPTMRTVLGWCRDLFGALDPATAAWHVETHQFRIEARAGVVGKPTPEGMHRDGVDHVLVLMIKRTNIASGTTSIHSIDRKPLGSFTLADPFDAALVEDRRCFHGVTPVEPIDPTQPAHRDVLVVTFRKA